LFYIIDTIDRYLWLVIEIILITFLSNMNISHDSYRFFYATIFIIVTDEYFSLRAN